MKTTRFLAFLALSLLLFAGHAPTGVAQGNSDAAHACKQGGFTRLVGVDGETFTNSGQCASFVAQGGIFSAGMIIPARQVATLDATLEACNALSWGYWTSNGAAGAGLAKESGCAQVSGGSLTVGPFASATILTISLADQTCGAAYDSYGNHAAVVQSGSGYLVNISDGGPGCGLVNEPAVPPGTANLRVVVTIV